MTTRRASREGSESRNGSSKNLPARNEPSESRQTDSRGFEKKPSKLNAAWAKVGLDLPTLFIMAKGALPPTIALSMYQATAVAQTFTTLGYLVGIVSILGMAIMPRAKFLQTMVFNIISVCFSTAIALLMIYCVVKARQHTEGTPMPHPGTGSPTPGVVTVSYNSSASAVAGIWLFVQIYAINTARAKFPQFIFPTIIYAIFVNVSTTYAPQFPTMTAGINFSKKLLESFLAGLGIATGVSLLILPITSRTIVFKEITDYIGGLQGALRAHEQYFQSLETADMFSWTGQQRKGKKKAKSLEAEAVKAAINNAAKIHGKLHANLSFAKREVAIGKLGPDDLKNIAKLLRAIMIPIYGLGSVIDIFERLGELQGWNTDSPVDAGEGSDPLRTETVRDWNDIMKVVHEPFTSIIETMDEALEHVLLTLELKKLPKSRKRNNSSGDEEVAGESSRPGEPGFAAYLEDRSESFYKGKQMVLQEWCKGKGIELAPDFFEHPADANFRELKPETSCRHRRNQRQLYLLLYIEFLLYATSRAILDLVLFTDEKRKSGKLQLIAPGMRRMRKWMVGVLKYEDRSGEDGSGMGDVGASNDILHLGEAYSARKDPEHLPPQNFFEKFGDVLRATANLLRSPESAFGFRAACATMSIGIVAFLHQTQTFFVRQRLVWAMIMVTISMNPTAGSSVFSFLLRIFGTCVAVVVSLAVWYIPDGHTAGILALLWFFLACGFYVIVKHPKFVIVGVISVVTTTLIIGYELEVRKIGQAVASSNGQPYYKIYLLAPYRLATVAGGLAVAFIWTFFPFPISEHSQLRKSLGDALYLLANYYSVIHETVWARIRGDEGDLSSKTSPGRRLEKARKMVFSKSMMVLDGLHTFSAFQKWEVPLGGKFPKENYDVIIDCVQNLINYMTLVAYASQTFTNTADEEETAWSNDFRRLMDSISLTSHEITSMLSLLSASVTNGQPLPPYLTAPAPYQLSRRLEALDKDILSVRHISEPGYAAFAVLQISTLCIIGDLEKLLKYVRNLVGELDFSFHVVSTTDPTPGTSSETLFARNGNREKTD